MQYLPANINLEIAKPQYSRASINPKIAKPQYLQANKMKVHVGYTFSSPLSIDTNADLKEVRKIMEKK